MTKLDCTDIKAMLSAIMDDELDREGRHDVERHLAECKPCRRMLDEAEAVDALLALDAAGGPAGSLPSGFEASVLARTTNAQRLRLRDRSWVTFGGWIASAAAIGLAMTIWIVDRRALLRQPALPNVEASIAADSSSLLSYASNISNSWIYEGPVESDLLAEPQSSAPVDEDGLAPPPSIDRIMQSVTMTREDAETIFAAALALDQLRAADDESFAELDVVRRIVEYDNLLPRLARAHERLSAEDRAAVLAAESIFTRIVRGPISAENLTEIGEMVMTLELPERLARIAKRSDSTMSL